MACGEFWKSVSISSNEKFGQRLKKKIFKICENPNLCDLTVRRAICVLEGFQLRDKSKNYAKKKHLLFISHFSLTAFESFNVNNVANNHEKPNRSHKTSNECIYGVVTRPKTKDGTR